MEADVDGSPWLPLNPPARPRPRSARLPPLGHPRKRRTTAAGHRATAPRNREPEASRGARPRGNSIGAPLAIKVTDIPSATHWGSPRPASPVGALCTVEELLSTGGSAPGEEAGAVGEACKRDKTGNAEEAVAAGPEVHREHVWESLSCTWVQVPHHPQQWVLCSLAMLRYKLADDRYTEGLPLRVDLFANEVKAYMQSRPLPLRTGTRSAPHSPKLGPRQGAQQAACLSLSSSDPQHGYSGTITTSSYLKKVHTALQKVLGRLTRLAARGVACTLLAMDQGASVQRIQALARQLGLPLPEMAQCDVISFAHALLPDRLHEQFTPPSLRYTEYGVALESPRAASAPTSPRTRATAGEAETANEKVKGADLVTVMTDAPAVEMADSVVPVGLSQLADPTITNCHSILDAAREQGRLFCNLHSLSVHRMSLVDLSNFPRQF